MIKSSHILPFSFGAALRSLQTLIKVTAIALPCSLALPSMANAMSGNELLEVCETGKTNQRDHDFCLGMINGAISGLNTGILSTLFEQNSNRLSFRRSANEMKEARVLFCFPDNVTRVQLVDIVVKYLKEHPQERHKDFAENVFEAVRYIWPRCK